MESVWSPAQMQQCAETVRARLGISTSQPQLRCGISHAFLMACQKQVHSQCHLSAPSSAPTGPIRSTWGCNCPNQIALKCSLP